MCLFINVSYLCLADECSSYTIINDETRNVNYVNSSAPQCDNKMVVKWYRLTGAAGVRMPSSCLPAFSCGTHASGWMQDPHPGVASGINARTVYFTVKSNCFYMRKAAIRVRNCGPFYVYKFQPTLCPVRYCGTN